MNKIDALQTIVDYLLDNSGIDPGQKQSFKDLINNASDTPVVASSPVEEQQDASLIQPELALTATEVVEPAPVEIAAPMEGSLPDPAPATDPIAEPAPVPEPDPVPEPAPAPIEPHPLDVDDTDAATFLGACGNSFDEAVQRLSIQYNKQVSRAS